MPIGTSIPHLASTTLAGEERSLPADLDAPTLLLFAYRQWQQSDVDTWLAVADAMDGLPVMELPVLGRRYLPARPMIDGGMARQLPDVAKRRTMCVYTDVSRLRRDLGIAGRDDVYASLVTASGEVAWEAFGPATSDAATSLRAARAALGVD